MDSDIAICAEHLTKRFGRKTALEDLTLDVRRGEVFGFVGENASGKTTTIRLMLGLAKPTAGTVNVLGEDPRDVKRAHLLMARLGYVSETRAMYDWMRVREIIDFCAGIHGPTWDHAHGERLLRDYNLDPSQKVKELSRGKRALLMLLLAVAHHPELLILDEPSSGLDPLARREILEQVIETIQSEGRTVFFSSHLLDEVERVADRVGFLHRGRLVAVDTLDNLHARWRRVRVVWPEAREDPVIPGLRRVIGNDREKALFTDRCDSEFLAAVRATGAQEIEELPMSLDDIFLELIRSQS